VAPVAQACAKAPVRSSAGRIAEALLDIDGNTIPCAPDADAAREGFCPGSPGGACRIRCVARADGERRAVITGCGAISPNGLGREQLDIEQRRRFGVILGTGGGGFEFTERMYALWYGGESKKASVYTIASSTHGTLSSELSMRFSLRGMSHVVSTGCTSSTD